MIEQDKAMRCAELVEKSKEVIVETFSKFNPADCAITWTGGKDSGLPPILVPLTMRDFPLFPKVA